MSDFRTPTLQEVIRGAIEAQLADLRVSMPGRIESYDAATQTAEVTPLLMVPGLQADGSITPVALQRVPGVPVCFPGGGGMRMTFPVKPNDSCVLVFADRSLDLWKAKGGGPLDPAVDGPGHSLPDAIAFVGLRPQVAPWQSAPTDRASFGSDSGNAALEVTASQVNVGRGADAGITRFEDLKAVEDAQTHIGNLGFPTGTPLVPLPRSIGSGVGKVAP